ncbi:hypothetical protein HPDFL43_00035540 [Hoeflea phototrophica DFL-43]|jgi:hypothetical protein|uniref:Uncharacterized protein n=1 Tax=Hoeflea phototrophica (strain DSM 17068 / NCIMB 14078 / DFL-43) TaxID=411684 RepID=A0A094Z080_HOEPD|nr:hypothetical protein [Hoeflea phototrophica]KGB27062.1 hypothetical protein HPDFL43_00035540 [Hoeflea phototrophica DFL-43]
MTKKPAPLPQVGGSYVREKDGSLKPVETGSKPETDPPATSAKPRKD